MAGEIIFTAAFGTVGLSLSAAATLGLAAVSKWIWNESFGDGNVHVDQVRILTNQIKNLEKNITELKSEVGDTASYLQENIKDVGVTASHLQRNIQELKSDSHSVGVTVRLIQENLKKETKPSYIGLFSIRYKEWNQGLYGRSSIKHEEKSGEVGEKTRILSEQLENCGKVDEYPKKVIQDSLNISHNGNVVELNKKLYDLTFVEDDANGRKYVRFRRIYRVPLEGISCELFRMDEQDIVAEAVWMTNDPTTLVHGCELGHNASKVWITNVVDPNAKVWRPSIGIQIMGEALKSTMAWPRPTDHIIYEIPRYNEAGGSGFDSGN